VSFSESDIGWVLLANGDWCQVADDSFRLEQRREWTANTGSYSGHHGYGFTFLTHEGRRYSGPIGSLLVVASAIKR
jgi:hypothetical protein